VARSVKYLGRLHHRVCCVLLFVRLWAFRFVSFRCWWTEVWWPTMQLTDQTKRDHWWAELREELCKHAQALSCPQIMG